MFSKIGYYIKPLLFGTDVVERPGFKKQREEEEGNRPAAPEDDAALFSVEAIRALLIQEKPDDLDTFLVKLDFLQRHGIASIPIRTGQSILAAITEAVAVLGGK